MLKCSSGDFSYATEQNLLETFLHPVNRPIDPVTFRANRGGVIQFSLEWQQVRGQRSEEGGLKPEAPMKDRLIGYSTPLILCIMTGDGHQASAPDDDLIPKEEA
ncbi:hypothetical protein EYF80_066450 [Liparis tanakae]|uniref:Uncharacterized protein n=1 Tax=Liparis tanakae TaxID=230148 RepID=A0A4Z2E3V8_9TELE|nr:hypothetical protein EYF80_066450 [Liparis tanakae]